MRADVPAVTHHRLLRDAGVHVDSRLLSGPSVWDVLQLLDPSPVEEMDSLQALPAGSEGELVESAVALSTFPRMGMMGFYFLV
ncbi:hypothetical protein D4764_15G0004360 [Takifugu flavidus]|uniref:Uncharacterized protein n=1 Tax=Takifugu flavidus TaxID=433684 RepID=A0A5C6NZT3_9TELE|nr:hypothetical protein D4764_15G0004360 [Takifugu flavidus]